MITQMTQMDPALEIRKLPPSIIREFAQILDYADSWKRLMAIIPKKLNPNNYICDVKPDNLPKYNSEDFKIIEQGKENCKRFCTEILFDEWGTSGRPRATLGHLKYLLTKAELFRAADYVAKLLNEEPPPRPTSGPAAVIPINLSEITHLAEIEKQLDKINYPNIAIEKIKKTSGEIKSVTNVIPEIVVSEVNLTTTSQDLQRALPIVPQNNSSNTLAEVSDMIQFSNSVNIEEPVPSSEVPELSTLLQQESMVPEINVSTNDNSPSHEFTPAFSQILADLPSQVGNIEPIPVFSQLLDESQPYVPDNSSDNFIPNLSALNQSFGKSDSDIIPDFDTLQSKSSTPSTVHIRECESSISNGSIKCPSPLPNLSLNTELPHFTYAELEATTNNFSATSFISENEPGRFLGSGAFGSVFLAIGLLNRPVAVKKIFLENVEIVNEDDTVTKQFKNEVEILSKYKHENLVSLLGYSCDGCTYCLIYEYVSTGALFDILEKNPQKLAWKQRIRIALGTAKAVAYLHTAFPTPLIHRDIKSANILLDADNNPKLCDFGIVKLLPSQKTDMHTTLYGTSAYMSPEYHRGDVSIKLDTFSFGVVLLELLTSLPPLDYNRQGADLVTYVEDMCEESIDPILDKSVGLWEENSINFAKDLYSLTLKCLDDKKKRPVMVEVVEILSDIVKNMG